MQLTHSLVAVLILFILKISETNAGCYWNGKCLLQCITSNTTSVIKEIEQVWDTDVDCHIGAFLRLRTLTYPNNAVPSCWFTADVIVNELEIYLSGVKSVSVDAFNANAFATVKKLTIENFEFALLANGTFNGLNQLEVINIKLAGGVNKIELGVLDTLTELREFTFEQSLKGNPAIDINGLTGSKALPKLEYVKIRYNLTDSIRKSTFDGLTNVKRLYLSSCQIRSIEDHSFDSISATIEELDLSGNALTTLSDGVFNVILPNIKTINVNGNIWHCDCELLHFRLFIENYQQNFNGYNCASPTECRNTNMLEAECFDDCETPPPTTSTSTTITTSTTTTTTSPSSDIIVECHNEIATTDSVSIRRRLADMTISENDKGELNFNIVSEQDTSSLVVIWFDENRNSGEIDNRINCLSKGSEIMSMPLNDLKEDIVYSFCLMHKTSTSVSPLDCVPYMKRHQEQIKSVWLYENNKALTISLVALGFLLNVIIGIAIGFRLMNFNQLSKHSQQISRFTLESTDGVSIGDRNKPCMMSNIYTRNTIATVIPFQNDIVKCPPLPERPTKFKEEPVYASVEYVE